jgi:hypothetical protein
MKAIICILFATLISHGAIAKECKNGKACGETCIAKGATCSIKQAKKVCKKGKSCGDTCIAKDAVCNK